MTGSQKTSWSALSGAHLRRLKLGICHPRIGKGGSEACAVWGITALKDEYDVTLITSGAIDIEGLNAFYGTSLRPEDFKVLTAPTPWWLNLLRRTDTGDALDGASYQKFCRKIASDFDVLISAYNFCDFGVPAIHLIADFSWDDALRRAYDPTRPGLPKFIYGDNVVRRAYLHLAQFLSESSGHSLFAGQDQIYANSQWTADVMRSRYGVNVSVLYPPVPGEFPSIPWARRENGFVCLGRIDSAKRIERIIDILARVRQRRHDVHLHIIGRIGDDAYGRVVAELCKAHPGWVIAEGAQCGNAKLRLLASHRFGIHGRNGEAFGIAVAEMVKAGCIPFVPKEGGQVEIVSHPLLTYTNVDDAAGKIVGLLEKPQLQSELCQHLAHQSQRFAVEDFMASLRTIVQRFLARQPSHCSAPQMNEASQKTENAEV